MRDFVNEILSAIGAESLTDQEYVENFAVGYWTADEWTQENYDGVKALLEDRESVSNTLDRLKSLFEAHGLDISGAAKTAASNIFIGSKLS
jgi:hypothetical protein